MIVSRSNGLLLKIVVKDYTIKTYINTGLLKESQPLYITINPHNFNLEINTIFRSGRPE